jgi:glycosyltransferase involved in cell wall biosynthesis
MKTIRVLHAITRLIVGGAQENTIYTAAMLDNSKFKVDVLSGLQTGSEGSLIEEANEKRINLLFIDELVREISPVNDGITLFKLYNTMRNNHYDIVHTHSSKAGILGRWAARLAGVPVIIHTIHGWSFHEYLPSFQKNIYIFLEKITARFTDVLVVVSESDFNIGINEGIGRKSQYRLIRSAIPRIKFNHMEKENNTIRKKLQIPDHVVVIGNVGRLSDQKNPLEWIHIAHRLSKEMENVIFLLVGDGPLRLDIEEEIKKLQLSEKVILTGLTRDVQSYLSIMDVFLITSLWEGLPRTVLQAMAMGIPVVAYKSGGIPEVVNDGISGYLCNPGDIDEMTKKTILLLKNPIMREEMGRKGRSMISNEFDLQVMIKQVSQLYFDLLNQKQINLW